MTMLSCASMAGQTLVDSARTIKNWRCKEVNLPHTCFVWLPAIYHKPATRIHRPPPFILVISNHARDSLCLPFISLLAELSLLSRLLHNLSSPILLIT